MTRIEVAAVIGRGLQIRGNTFAHKDAIRAQGCAWNAAKKAWYAPSEGIRAACQAIVDGTIYNSPTPADLTGDEDPVSLAAKHGRTAVVDAKVVSFSCYGLDRGDNGKPNGSIRVVKGVRYVQVARTKRVYCSRDWLEDMDLFGKDAGGHYTWDGVPIEPTAEESAEEAKKAGEKAEANAKREAEIADVLSGKTPIDVRYHDGEYLSGWQAFGASGELLCRLGMANQVSGWGVHVNDRRIDEAIQAGTIKR